MSEEALKMINSTHNPPQEMKNKLTPITFQDLMSFKEELLKDLREYKSKTTKNVNNEFDKYKELIEKANIKMDFIEKEKSLFILKSEFTQEKNNIFSEISNKESEINKKIMLNEVQINSCQKDIEDSIYRYDKAIIDNLQVPGLIGNSCRFPNLKEYILTNKDELNNCLMINNKNSISFKSYKKKNDMDISQINEKIKSQEYKLSNLIHSKFNETKDRFEGLYEALDEKINNLSNVVNLDTNQKNKEIEKINNLINENSKQANQKNDNLKEELISEIEDLKTKFHKIKKNIVNLSGLLMGKNNGLNKQMVINNFNNMMKNLFKDLNIDKINFDNNNDLINNNNEQNNNNNNNENSNQSHLNNMKNKYPTPVNKKLSFIKPKASSSIKDYIEGKISAKDTKYNNENKIKKKNSFILNNPSLLNINNEIGKYSLSTNNINIVNAKNNKRLSVKIDTNPNLLKEIKEIGSSFSENTKNSERENNQKRSSLNIIRNNNNIENKYFNSFYENVNNNNNNKDSQNINNDNNIIINKSNEIINEEDSNNFSSSTDSQIQIKNEEIIEKESSKDKSKEKLDVNIKEIINKKNDSESSNLSSCSRKINNSIDSSKMDKNNNNTNNNINKNCNINKENNEIENQYILTCTNITNNTIPSNSTNQIINANDKENNNIQSINNYYVKTINNYQKLNNNNENIIIKSNLSVNEKVESNEKSLFLLNKIGQNSKISLKKNFDLKSLKNNISHKYNILSLKKNMKKNEIFQMSPNQTNKISQSTYQTINSNQQNKNNSSLKNNNNINNNLNYISKTVVFQNNDLMIKSTRNKSSHLNNNIEKENNFSSFDNLKINLTKKINNYNVMPRFKSDKKDREFKIKFIDKKNKDILLDKNTYRKIRLINDEEIIDKPLISDKNIFKIDKNKGFLENKIIELEYFTKKKFDELVKEIKIFIPIHFNSHLRDYSNIQSK